jgi:arabinofuranosyltransferase
MKQVIGGMFIALAFGVYAYAVYNTAWLSDDAYISYRTVDNLAQGYGMTWNTTERVQAFTNPLWVILNVPAYLAVKEPWQIYFSGLATSVIVSFLAVGVLALGAIGAPVAAVFGIVALTFSRAFVDYSTSGLENPMTHLLLALFMLYLVRIRWTMGTLFSMSLCVGLSLTNRLDTALIFGPVLVYAWMAERNLKATAVVLAGLSPFIAWEVFSVIYYGFPFPNTAYAKLGSGIDTMERLTQGLWYFKNAWDNDPLTLILIVLGLAGAPLALREGRYTAFALGGVLYLLYLINVGGDFMQGRLFTPVLMVAVLLLLRAATRSGGGPVWAMATVAAVLIGFQAPETPLSESARTANKQSKQIDAHRIADERKFYLSATGFRGWKPGVEYPRHQYADKGRSLNATGRYQANVFMSVGFRGYFAGQKTHIIDQYALGDPLMARLPSLYDPKWRIGHFTRMVPRWYLKRKSDMVATLEQKQGKEPALSVDAVTAAVPVQLSPLPAPDAAGEVDTANDLNLQAYYDRLELIVRGPIWSRERWETILNMNLGRFDHLIATDRYQFPDLVVRKAVDFGTPKAEGSPWNAPGNVILQDSGMEVQLEGLAHNSLIEISADNNDEYRILFRKNGETIAKLDTAPVDDAGDGLKTWTFSVPNKVIRAGYDAVRIVAYGGDGRSSVGHLRLQ